MTLADKVVVITGAESGIGLSIAKECLAQGARVCMAGIIGDLLAAEAQALVAEFPGRVMHHVVDISDYPQLEAMIEAAHACFGKIDGLVANAGIVKQSGAFHEIDFDDWDRTIRINLTGTFYTLRAVVAHFERTRTTGSILVTGSSSAVRVVSGLTSYIASKGGVHMMAQALALELAPKGIRVNILVPGQTNTPAIAAIPGYKERAEPLLPMRALAEPEELAKLAAFALSDAAPHMTGSQLKIDSGRTIA